MLTALRAESRLLELVDSERLDPWFVEIARLTTLSCPSMEEELSES